MFLDILAKESQDPDKLKKSILTALTSIIDVIGDKIYQYMTMKEVIDMIITNISNKKSDEVYILERVNNELIGWIAYDIDELVKKILSIYYFLNTYEYLDKKIVDDVQHSWNAIFEEFSSEIKTITKLNDIRKNHKTYEIYKEEITENHQKYKFYISWAIGLAVVGFILSIFSKIIFTKCLFGELCVLEYNNIDYWIMKASIIFITITGITFCIKQAIHHQKKKDKAEQTRLELEALPTYMFNFSDEQKNEVYKELAGKYFGRDFNNEGYQDMSNIIQEQIKLSHEVLKTIIANQKNGNQP